jgi:hypothetical protein
MKQFQNIGINLTRIAGESDEEYFKRISLQAQALSQDEQLQDGSSFIIQQFISQMKTLGLPLSTVENINSQLPVEVNEYILSIWIKFKAEFRNYFGDNILKLSNKNNCDAILHLINK